MSFFDSNYNPIPDRNYLRELRRPWKLITFMLGMGWLFYGAIFYGIGDWDIGISIIMGTLTYLLAPWSVFMIVNALRYRPHWWWLHILSALIPALLVVDTSYVIYHSLAGNAMYRDANFRASISLYFLAGVAWLYRGSQSDFLKEIRTALQADRVNKN